MSTFCPNFSNKQVKQEFQNLEDYVGENLAYYLWDKYEGDYAKASQEALAMQSERLNRAPSANPEQFAQSRRIVGLMQTLYPEIDLKFVDSIEGNYAGTIDLDAMQALVDFTKQGSDTIPHEYAHYYVEMFSNSEVVKQGIEQFGSKEKLVQAIGIRVANMDGKARTWWQKFKDFVKGIFSSKYAKNALLAEITDAFLTNANIGVRQTVTGKFHQEIPTKQQVLDILSKVANSIIFDPAEHKFTDKATNTTLESVSVRKQKANYDNYDVALEDALQAQISDEARRNGTLIHAVLESVLKGKLDTSAFEGYMTKSAMAGLIKVINKLKENYDFVASETMLSDPEHGVAGIADLILKDKKTGEYVLMDFKTKLINYNNKKDGKGNFVNEKGTKLRGFLFSTSKKFRIKSERDGYDFQLSTYKHMLESYGIPISKTAIVPIVYSVEKGKITKAGLSTVFGSDEDQNAKLKSNGYFEIVQTSQTKYDVEYVIFGNKSIFGEDVERVDSMLKELGNTVQRIQKKLDIQSKVLQLKRRYRTQARDAENLLERIANMTELDALLQYVNYAADHLSKLNKQIKERYKLGKDAKWDLNVLQSYKEIASSYDIVKDISGLANKYADIFGDDNVRAIEAACSRLQTAQRNILYAYDTVGSQLYLDEILPYVGIVRHRIRNEVRVKYIEENPKRGGESNEEFKQRVQEYVDKYLRENSNRIEQQTKEWLDAQRHIADAGFECNSILSRFGTVYESVDPFVQAVVQRFDFAISEKEQRMIAYKAKLQRVLKAYRVKYGLTNFSNLRESFDDFIEVTENGISYLVNPFSGAYLQAEKQARNNIFHDGSKTYKEQQKAWQEWLKTNNPIYDVDAYNNQLNNDIEPILETLTAEQKKIVKENLKLPVDERKSWFALYKDGTITADIRQEIEDLLDTLDNKYRRPNPALYANDKYQKMLALKDSNDPKWQLYQIFLDSLKKYDESMPKSLRLNFRLPSIRKRGMERVNQDGVTSAAIEHVKSETISMEDDDIRGTFVDEQGKRIKMIPMYYYEEGVITEEQQSYDLPTIFYKWVDAADTYLVKRDLESVMLQTSAILGTRETKDKVISLLKGRREETSSHKTNTQDQFDSWIDQVFYNNRVQEMGKIKLPYTDKVIDTAKLIKWLISLSNKRTMSANLVAGLNNILVGEVNQAEEAFAGQHINKESYTRATKVFFQNFFGLLGDAYKTVPQNKLNKIAEWFGIFESGKNMTLEGFMRHSLDDIMYSPNKIGEHEMQIRFVVAALMTMDAKDENGKVIGKMYDFIDFDEDNQMVVDDKVANFSRQEQNTFSLKIRRVLISLHGNYSDRASVAAEAVWYGWMGLALRRWLESTVYRRFRRKHYDSILDTDIGGMYRDFFSFLFQNEYTTGILNFVATHIFKAKEIQIKAMKWSTMADDEKRNVIRTAVELGIATLAYAMFALINPSGDGDDHDYGTEALWILKYQSYRLYTDITFYLLPTSFSRILQDPFPVISYTNDIIRFFVQFTDPFEEYKTGRHLVDNKLINQGLNLIPGIKQLGRAWNTSQEINSFINRR